MPMFKERKFEVFWRKVYEAEAAVGWGVAVVSLVVVTAAAGLPPGPTIWMVTVAGIFGIYRLGQALRIWNKKFALAGKGVDVIDPAPLMKKIQSLNTTPKRQQVYLGKGFEWRREHQQRIYDLKKYDLQDFMPPDWFMKMRGVVIAQQPAEAIGAPWIHGVSTKEDPINVPLEHMEGQTLVLGTTGAGKTRLAEILVSQAIWRGETVIFIDPKFDKDLCDRMFEECKRSGREKDFMFFHPAFPGKSVRIDPLANFGKVTELASRIAALMPGSGEASSFQSFAWRAVNIISQGLVETYDQPTLLKLRQYVEGGAESLLERVLIHHFKKVRDAWENEIVSWINRASKGELTKYSQTSSVDLIAYVHYYDNVIAASGKRSEVIDGLMSAYKHNREHYTKMIASLLPVMDMLTSGHLGKMLSPDVEDIEDTRRIVNSHQIIKSKGVLYMALDSLPDKTVASAIGSIMLADLAAVAGAIYNYATERNVVTIFVDEASEVVNEPFLSILNKSRGAGFRVNVFTQTLPDFVATMGSEDKALQMLGNLNNMIALRTKDGKTQKYITETFGTAYVENLQYALGTNTQSTSGISSFSGGEGVRMSETLEEVVPQELLGKLPNFQFFASVSGGKILKGRVPLFAPIPIAERYTNLLLKA